MTPLLIPLSILHVVPTQAHASPAESPCPSSSGLLWVGTLWEYTLLNPLYRGYERAELTILDTETGTAELLTTGTHEADAFTYAFERTDRYLCDEVGFQHLGWTSVWSLLNLAGDTLASGTLNVTLEPPALLLPTSFEVGDTWITEFEETVTTGLGAERSFESGFGFHVLPDDELALLGTTLTATPVYEEVTYNRTWYADEIGVVQREGLFLTSYAPGAGLTP